ncbi:hypothetical protein [Roseomonas fluvialis]|uniref:Sulfotransferase family protein n=1 Tax=Roseomonas fluvialis TaxID=1750527 RepID=A0ABN6NV59_9PROT|nr:hypothetical protein [Roseomonas fluvialis]BDG70333.1 hypothetical protein Rmf_02620 [Roseomonas fluvialis]
MPVSRDDILHAHRALLGRAPRDEAVVTAQEKSRHIGVVIAEILASEEWRSLRRRHAGDTPPWLVTNEEVAAIWGMLLGRAPENDALPNRFRAAGMSAVDVMVFVMRSGEFRKRAGARFSRAYVPDAEPDAPAPAGHGAMRAPFGIEPRLLPLYHFLHIPKTAGTSVSRVFDRMFRSLVLYAGGIDLAAAVRTDPAFFHNYLLVTGHIDVNNPAAKAEVRENVFLSVFRDPAPRAASLYDYIRGTPKHPLHAQLQGLTLAEAFRSFAPFRQQVVNAQLRIVFGATNLQQVRHALQTRSYVLGRSDALNDFLDAVAHYTGFPRPPAIPRLNASDRREGGPEPASAQPGHAEVMAEIAEASKIESSFIEQWLSLPLSTVGRPREPARPET